MVSPLVCADEKYIGILRRNVDKIIKIINNAKEANAEFKKELDSKCSSFYEDTDIKLILEKLIKRCKELEKEQNSGNENKDEV